MQTKTAYIVVHVGTPNSAAITETKRALAKAGAIDTPQFCVLKSECTLRFPISRELSLAFAP